MPTLGEAVVLERLIAAQPDRIAAICVRYRIDPRLLDTGWKARYGWQVDHIERVYERACARR
jgi:hypothetical protein